MFVIVIITIALRITFMEAINGAKKTVTYERVESCQFCKGTGEKNGSGRTTCSACKGTGMKTARKGNVIFSSTCTNCQGSGSIIKEICR